MSEFIQNLKWFYKRKPGRWCWVWWYYKV